MDNYKAVKKILSDKFGVSDENITPEADLTGDLNLANLEINDLMALIAREFKLTFSDTDTISPQTVNDLLDIIEEFGEGI
ncbi:MAG: hypothetical protein UV73_C0002G0108 [Candidatus Gottesmanbacteria bacterium GW2011_GWA2_43_14]|uniref:Carrier domain-containing protein n=1 Tax=Candidatus Gottesmanbacteria bacterium GW2011_GWA2_43_14 TaxID=1618443 RepID=A0A0G1DL65_9BACT|nr:MAG: hypothetical protein UV73_C0002G0108 [Candidatus Gottesmanbacteria bacterium GW2011_GWA2_43_14]